jgi:phage shock protein E
MLKRSNLKWLLPGLLIGAVAGFFYWKFYGCNGTCLITSSPLKSILYFSVMGALVNNMFKPQQKQTDESAGNN